MFEISNSLIIIVLLAVFVIFLSIYVLLFLFSFRIRKQTYMKLIKSIVLFFFVISVAGTFVLGVFVQPKLKVVEKDKVTPSSLIEIINAAERNDEIVFPEEHLKEEWAVTSETLQIQGDGEMLPHVIVDQHLASGEQGKISLYETETLVNGTSVLKDVTMANIQLNEDTLYIYPFGKEQMVNYASYSPILTMKQFRPNESKEFHVDYAEQVLYIQVSPEVRVTANEEADVYYRVQ